MSKDQSSFFTWLLQRCIRDDYVGDERVLKESLLFTLLGMGCSVLTVYALSLLGLFV